MRLPRSFHSLAMTKISKEIKKIVSVLVLEKSLRGSKPDGD